MKLKQIVKTARNFGREFLLSSILVGSLSLSACEKKESILTPEDTLIAERQKIVNTYRSWSAKLIAQDFGGAMSYCAPGSNCEGRTRVHRETWNMGGQSYDDITYVEAWLTEEDLSRNYGKAVGNTTYYQYVPSQGDVEYKQGFYSSTRRIDGRWKIDGINSNLDPDWWRK